MNGFLKGASEQKKKTAGDPRGTTRLLLVHFSIKAEHRYKKLP